MPENVKTRFAQRAQGAKGLRQDGKVKEDPQAEPPRASWVQDHTAGRRPHPWESAAYARLTPVGVGTGLNSLAPWPAGREERRVGWSRSLLSRSPAGRAGAPCGDRPASRPPAPGPARRGPTGEEERRGGRPGAGKEEETGERGQERG